MYDVCTLCAATSQQPFDQRIRTQKGQTLVCRFYFAIVGSRHFILRLFSPKTRTFRFKDSASSSAESPFALSPLDPDSQTLLSQPRKEQRKIGKQPLKILDAPGLIDDFYCSLVDWSATNFVAIGTSRNNICCLFVCWFFVLLWLAGSIGSVAITGLGGSVWVWHAPSCKVVKLCDVPDPDTVTSVSWSSKARDLFIA